MGAWLVSFAVVVTDYYAGSPLFGDYEIWMFGALFFVGVFLISRMPGPERS